MGQSLVRELHCYVATGLHLSITAQEEIPQGSPAGTVLPRRFVRQDRFCHQDGEGRYHQNRMPVEELVCAAAIRCCQAHTSQVAMHPDADDLQ